MTTQQTIDALVLREADGTTYLLTPDLLELARCAAAERTDLAPSSDDAHGFLLWRQGVVMMVNAELVRPQGRGLALGHQVAGTEVGRVLDAAVNIRRA